MLSFDKIGDKPLLIQSFVWAIIQGSATPLVGLNLQDSHPFWPAVLTGIYFLAAIVFFPFPSMLMKRVETFSLAKIAVFLAAASIIPMGTGLSPMALAVCRMLQGISSTLLLVSVETELLKKTAPADRAGALGGLEVCLVLGAGTGAASAPLAWSISPWLAGFFPTLPAMAALMISFRSEVKTDQAPIGSIHSGQKSLSSLLFLLLTAMAQGLVEGVLMAFLTPWLLSNNWHETAVSIAFGSLFAGIISSQLFLSRLAGRHGYGLILILCHLGVSIGFFGLACPNNHIMSMSSLFLIGLGIGCQYPVAQAAMSESLSPHQIPLAASVFLASNGFGCLISSPSGGFIQSIWGTVSLYNSIGLFCLAMVLTGLGDRVFVHKTKSQA